MSSAAKDTIDLMKSAVRPILIVSGWVFCLMIWGSGGTPPDQLWYVVLTLSGEYAVEEGVKRTKQIREGRNIDGTSLTNTDVD